MPFSKKSPPPGLVINPLYLLVCRPVQISFWMSRVSFIFYKIPCQHPCCILCKYKFYFTKILLVTIWPYALSRKKSRIVPHLVKSWNKNYSYNKIIVKICKLLNEYNETCGWRHLIRYTSHDKCFNAKHFITTTF